LRGFFGKNANLLKSHIFLLSIMAKEKKPSEEDEKKNQAQEKYMELQMINQQVQESQKQIEAVDKQIEEIAEIKSALAEFKNCKPGSEMLAPISSGIFVKAKVEKTEELAVNVGSNTVVTKSVDATRALLEKQLTEIRIVHEELQKNIAAIQNRAKEISAELQNLIG